MSTLLLAQNAPKESMLAAALKWLLPKIFILGPCALLFVLMAVVAVVLLARAGRKLE